MAFGSADSVPEVVLVTTKAQRSTRHAEPGPTRCNKPFRLTGLFCMAEGERLRLASVQTVICLV